MIVRNPSYISSVTIQFTDRIGEYVVVDTTRVPYVGMWADAKGDNVAKTAEVQQQQFDASLMQIFQSQYATQQSQLSYLQKQLQPGIDAGGIGYRPDELAAMRTSATDTNAAQFQNAQDALNNQVSQNSGGSKLTGVAGATTEADAALLNSEAQTQSASQQAITAANANLRQSNYWNSINALNGVAAEENPLGYASSATSGTGAVANASQAFTASNQSQLLGALGGIAGGVGSALGGGFSKGGLFGCWIAASFYGWNSLKTKFLRLWLHAKAPVWFRNFYLAYGEGISKTPLRWAFFPVFESVLRVY